MDVFTALVTAVSLIALIDCCSWNLNKDLPNNDPIYMMATENDQLLIPGPSGLMLETGKSMRLMCPGKSNVIKGTNQQELTATCTADNKLNQNNIKSTLKELTCVNSASSDLILTGLKCAGKGEVFTIGFNSIKRKIPLFHVCYDKVNEATFYTIHHLHGNAIAAAEINSDRPSFRTQGLTYGTTTANQYKQTEQKTQFTTLLGQIQAERYITTTSYLARGHLAPDADFPFDTWSLASYYYVNAAPEWQVVNAGNWLLVEDLTRKIADQRKEKLLIYTGVHGVLQLPNSKGKMVDIYLMTNKRLAVPKYFWKIIYSESKKEGIALVTLNNPHTHVISMSDIFCKNICKETSWDRTQWTRFDKGFTFCCAVNELVRVVGTMPPLNVNRNLIGPVS